MTKLRMMLATVAVALVASATMADDPWVVYEGGEGPGEGKHVVIIAGDEEYRSEEAAPMLGKILAVRHGFKCTVLFSVDPETGLIDPINQTNIPGLKALDDADMMIILTRFRELPDEDMKHVDEFVNSGKAIMGLRTATHAFAYKRNKESPYAKYSFRDKNWVGGFGQQVLGETWVAHHGHHKHEATRGVINEKEKNNPILNGVEDVFGPSDVYTVKNLTDDATVLLYGQVLEGMEPDSKPLAGPKNDPMMPLAWTKTFTGSSGKPSRVFCTTAGASIDLASEDLRRLLINGVYWGCGLEDKIPERANADVVGEFKPTFYGFGAYQKGLKPSDHKLP